MARKKRVTHHEEEGGEAWLLPYSDLMTLLLAVFIVLFAVSQIDKEKAEEMSSEFSGQMMTQSYSEARISGMEEMDSEGVESELEKMERLKAELDAKLKSEHMDASITTGIDKRGLVISLSNAIFFDPGSAEIKKDNEKTLLELANMASVMDNFIRIEGHTDDVPMSSELYRSNWELSAARAANVVRLLTGESDISPNRLIAVGYGEYRPVADNSTEGGRAKNRRIDIIVLSDKYNDLEQ